MRLGESGVPRAWWWLLALTLVELGFSSRISAQEASLDPGAKRKITEAMVERFDKGDARGAEGLLRGVDTACADRCSNPLKAELWMYIGVTSMERDPAASKEAFRRAFELDPQVTFDAGRASEPAKQAFYATAAESAGAAPTVGDPIEQWQQEAEEPNPAPAAAAASPGPVATEQQPAPTTQPPPTPAAPPPPVSSTAPPAAPPARGVRTHDGFFLRMAIGFGATSGSMQSAETLDICDDEACYGGRMRADWSGLAVASELSIGGTVGRRVVLGFGIFGHTIPTLTMSQIKFGSGSQTVKAEQDVEFDSGSLFIYGPFIDIYFKPESGFHLQGAIGYASFNIEDGTWDDGTSVSNIHHAGGTGVLVGLGYEWWIGDQWSAGILGRLAYGSVKGKDEGIELEHKLTIPSLLATFTFH